MIARLHFHPPTGGIAIATALRGREAEAAHARVPLLHLLDGGDPAVAPARLPIHTGERCLAGCCFLATVMEAVVQAACKRGAAAAAAAGLSFWTSRDGDSDSVVSKLRFPRYAHVIRCARQPSLPTCCTPMTRASRPETHAGASHLSLALPICSSQLAFRSPFAVAARCVATT